MNLNLSSHVALVSGSSRGLGLSIAQTLLQEGAQVIINGRSKAELTKAERFLAPEGVKGSLKILTGDLTQSGTIKRLLAPVKRLDILIANIGSGRGEIGYAATDKSWDDLLNVNLLGAMRLVRAAVPLLKASGKGNIVFISSVAGLDAIGAPLAYGAAKAGLLHCTKELAIELAPYRIRVNAVAPGNILFPGGVWDSKLRKNRSQVQRHIRQVVPMNRFGSPIEIANVVAFVASPKASFMTGACVVADGGQTLGH